MSRLFVVVIFTCLLWPLQADTIYFKKGGSQSNVEVISENLDKTQYQASEGVQGNYRTELIEWVQYSDAPQAFLAGRNALKKENYERAIYTLKEGWKIARQYPNMGKWIDVYSSFYLAKAHHMLANNEAADAKQYKNALSYYQENLKTPDNRFFYQAQLGLAQCHIHLEQYQQAVAALATLENKARTYDSDKWLFEALYWAGNALLQEQKYLQAQEKYRDAASHAKRKELTEEHRQAILAIANVYIQKQDFSQAISYLEGIKRDASEKDWELLAGVDNGLAYSYLGQGDVLKARELAIKVMIEYYQATQEKAQTFYILGRCYQQRATQEQGALERAKIYYEMLRDNFQNNPWKTQAIQRLQNLK